MARTNAEIKMRFRRIDDWSGLLSPFICGWPNFEEADYHDGRGLVYGHYRLADAVADWRDLDFINDLGAPVEYPLREMFTRTHDFAVRQGYQLGFPNFQQAVVGGREVRGAYLIVPGTAEWRDVPAKDLGLGNGNVDPESYSMDEWYWRIARYATARGYVAGMPNGHRANYGNGFVCGVFLFPQGTAAWVDIPGTELGLPSGLPPPPPTPPTTIRGTMVVTLTASTVSSWYLVATTSDPTTWRAKITSLRNRHSEDIRLTHTDQSGEKRGPVTAPKSPDPYYFPNGVGISDFNGMTVAGDWLASLVYVQGHPPSTIAFEIDWAAP